MFFKIDNKFLNKAYIYLSSVVKGFLIYVVGLSLMAIIMNILNLDSVVFYYLIYVFMMIGSFVCGVSTYKKRKGRGFLTGIISSIPYSILVFLITAILIKFNLSVNVLLVFLLSAMGGFLGGITAANTKI